MPKPAVAVAANSELGSRLDSLGRQIGYGRRPRPGRAQVLAVLMVILAIWLLFTFGKALTQLNDATQREAAAAAETRSLQAQLAAGRRELTLVQTDAFQAIQARALGMGGPGEKIFALTADAPPPPAIVPLGQSGSSSATKSPLDAWLELIFGS